MGRMVACHVCPRKGGHLLHEAPWHWFSPRRESKHRIDVSTEISCLRQLRTTASGFCLVGAFLALRMPSGVRSRSRRTSRRCLVLRHDKLAELPAPSCSPNLDFVQIECKLDRNLAGRLQLHDACVSVRRLTEARILRGAFDKTSRQQAAYLLWPPSHI